ncbi:citrate synthase [Anaerofilum sp. An201]|nr:citrate/2-methylcitrate synthase [Anaerofilum sp. An201]OUP03854.1 citrate synthase [Anaerofilum sp. An201]
MASNPTYSDITPEVEMLAKLALSNSTIDPEDYTRYNVKRGLRDLNGKGVLAGLTEIADVHASETLPDGTTVPCDGELYYRGYNVRDLVKGFVNDHRLGFEETAYLLMFGQLPNAQQLHDFDAQLCLYRSLPSNFVRDVILKAPNKDIMNALARSILTLASYDDNPDDISLPNVVRQCIQLIAVFPMLAVYSYQAYSYSVEGKSLFIHAPDPNFSTAENILHLLRADSAYTPLEALLLDLCLVLHAEHGGGNNSTFTTHVVTSSGTDTYSCMAAALASLKGPKHGGANLKVVRMFDDLKANVSDWEDEQALTAYLDRLLNKEGFDKSGLIYGMGHAVYSLSDPRARVLKGFVRDLSAEKGMEKEFLLYDRVERLAADLISHKRKIYKGVSANVDFYSGFVYRMLGLPMELFTPIFAIARVAGWSAHRIEELINMGKIIRPAYRNVCPHRDYLPMEER